MYNYYETEYRKFQFLIGTVQQQYLCGLSNTLFQNIVYNMPKSRSIYFLESPKNNVKSAVHVNSIINSILENMKK